VEGVAHKQSRLSSNGAKPEAKKRGRPKKKKEKEKEKVGIES
jgi:hypothetical protein